MCEFGNFSVLPNNTVYLFRTDYMQRVTQLAQRRISNRLFLFSIHASRQEHHLP
jgi:hypothetical protein